MNRPRSCGLGLVVGLAVTVMANPVIAGVNPDGTFAYSIAIKVPPGRAGMQPHLSLDYSSSAPNGELGVGWRLGGLRAITRSGADGGPPRYAGTDLYFLDGQKLISIGGGQYRTRNETWQTIVAAGTCGDGPCSFTATSTDGTVSTFAATADSRVEAVGKGASVRAWALSSVHDLHGNAYEVTYAEDTVNGDCVPVTITYTKPGTQFHTVTFSWQTRTDVEVSYADGALVRADQRLAGIEVRSGTLLQRKYVLAYDYAAGSGRSRLLSVQECGTDGTTCLPAQSFGWQGQAGSFARTTGLANYSPSGGFTNASVFPIITGDWDGDGRTDWARVDSQGVRFFRSTDAGWVQYAYVTGWAPGAGFPDAGAYPIYTGDWNGDGKTDWGRVQAGEASFFVSTGTGFTQIGGIAGMGPGGGLASASTNPILTGDWDGDGRTDWARVDAQGVRFFRYTDTGWVQHAYVTGWSPAAGFTDTSVYPIYTGDWNGDGKTDWGRVQASGATFFLSDGTGFTQGATISGWGPAGGFTDAGVYPVYTGDWNGDGKTDWGRVQASGATFFLSDGTGFTQGATISGWGPSGGFTSAGVYPVYTGDWNGDGKTDWGRVQSAGATFFVSTGNGFKQTTTISGWGPAGGFTDDNVYPDFSGDWNGDGVTDWGRVQSSEASFFTMSGAAPDLIVSSSNGLGATTAVTYQLSTAHPGAIAAATAYPTPASTSPRPLVTQLRTVVGASTYATTYGYSDGRLYHSARWEDPHSLGFASVTTTDAGTGNVTIATYSQGPATGDDLRLAGLVMASDVRDAAGALWSHTVNTYELAGPAPFAGQEIDARLKKTEVFSYNRGVRFNKRKTVNTYNADGLVKSVASYSGADVLDTTTTTTFGTACPGSLIADRPTQVTVTGVDGTSRTQSTTYNASCDVASKTVAGLTTTYAYDASGNPTSVTDPRGAVTTTTYDGGTGPFAGTLPGQVTTSGAGIVSRTSATLYDGYGRVSETRDINFAATGRATATTYDVLHRPLTVSVGGTARTRYSYPGWTQTQTETLREDGTWNASVVTADALGRTTQTKAQYDDGATVKWLLSCTEYDAQGRAFRTSLQAFDACSASWMTTSYDPLGRVSGVTYADGRPPLSYLYDGLTTTVRTAADASRDTVTTLDSRGRVATRTEPESATITYKYNDQDQLLEVAAAGGKALRIGYDGNGRRTTIEDTNLSTGVSRTDSYDAHGDLASTVDAKGNTITYEHDVLGRETRRCFAAPCSASSAVTTTYDTGAIAGSTRTMLGVVAATSSPAIGKEAAWSQAFGFDARGRPATTSLTIDGQSYVTRTAYYDTTDTARCVALPDGSVMRNTYTASGKNLKRIDYFDYTAAGVCPAGTTGAPAHSIVYSGYTAMGNAGTVQYYSAGSLTNTSTHGYTAWGAPSTVSTVRGASGTALESLQYSYTPNLELQKIDDTLKAVYAGVNTDRTQAYRYDDQGRLIQAAAGAGAGCTASACTAGSQWAGATRSYAFDAIGNLTSKDGVSLTYSATYPQRLANFGGTGNSYSHDANGSVTLRKEGATWWRYTYNANLMMTQAERSTDSGASYSVVEKNTFIGETRIKKDFLPGDPASRIQTYYLGGGFEVRVQPDGTRLHTAYIIGPSGRVASLTRNAGASPSYLAAMQSYTHESLADLGGPTVIGRLSNLRHRFLAVAHGQIGRVVLAWSAALTIAAVLAALAIWLAALARARLGGRRRRITARPATRYSAALALGLVGGQALLVACSTGGERLASTDLLVAALELAPDGHTIAVVRDMLTGTTTSGPPVGSYFLLNNHVGSNSVIVHAVDNCTGCQGTHAATVNYYPYGEINRDASTGQDLVTFKFAGKELDAETGLYNFGARMYDPDTGRFLSLDTAVPEGGWDSQGLNRYMYARGNPISFTDPTGHTWKDNLAAKAARQAARQAVDPQSSRGQKLQQAFEDAQGAAAWLARHEQSTSLNSVLGSAAGGNPFAGGVTATAGSPIPATTSGCMSEACIVGRANYSTVPAPSTLRLPDAPTIIALASNLARPIASVLPRIMLGSKPVAMWSTAMLGGLESPFGLPEYAPYTWFNYPGTVSEHVYPLIGGGGSRAVDAATYFSKAVSDPSAIVDMTPGGTTRTYLLEKAAVKLGTSANEFLTKVNPLLTIATAAYEVAKFDHDVEHGKASNFNIITGHWETKINGTWTYWDHDHWQQMGANDDGWDDHGHIVGAWWQR